MSFSICIYFYSSWLCLFGSLSFLSPLTTRLPCNIYLVPFSRITWCKLYILKPQPFCLGFFLQIWHPKKDKTNLKNYFQTVLELFVVYILCKLRISQDDVPQSSHRRKEETTTHFLFKGPTIYQVINNTSIT